MAQSVYAPVAARPAWVIQRLRALADALALDAPTRQGFLFEPDEAFYAACTASIVSLQGAAARIVRHLGLRCEVVTVVFLANLPAAAHIEHDGAAWHIEIDARWRDDARSLGAILAHEVCHILVRERGIPRFGTVVDEVHVDLAVLLAGLGALTLNGNRVESTRSGEVVTTRRWAFGYLAPELLVRAYAEVVGSLRVPHPVGSLEDGATRLEVWWYALRARVHTPLRYGPAGPGFIPCPRCDKVLRVPPGRRGRARCPACGAEQQVDGRLLRVGPPASGRLVDAPLPATAGVEGLLLRVSLLRQRAGWAGAFTAALFGFLVLAPIVEWLNKAEIGEACNANVDCRSEKCLLPATMFPWQTPAGPGVCTQECTTDADCAGGMVCADTRSVDPLGARAEVSVRACVGDEAPPR